MVWLLWTVVGIFFVFGIVVFRGAPYVPTKRSPLQDAFDRLYPLGADDVLVDIGSGDGVVLREAAKRGARAVGYELNPLLVLISRVLSRSSLIKIHFRDFWLATLPADTTLIYTFGESRDIKKMYAKAADTATLYGKEVYFMSFGFPVPGERAIKKDGMFFLYRLKPLHHSKA